MSADTRTAAELAAALDQGETTSVAITQGIDSGWSRQCSATAAAVSTARNQAHISSDPSCAPQAAVMRKISGSPRLEFCTT